MGLSTQRISIEDSIPSDEETDTVDIFCEEEISYPFTESSNESKTSSVLDGYPDSSSLTGPSEPSPLTPNDSVFTFVS